MEKPRVAITAVDFTDRSSFLPHSHTVTIHIATITYHQTGVDYPLKAYGEAATHQAALQDALTALDWNVVLDSHYTDTEVSLLKTVYQLYREHGLATWYQETVLAGMSEVDMPLSVENNPLRMLAQEKLLLRQHEDGQTLFRLSDLGQYVVEAHPQFQPPG
jgi:hypothetical protein